MQASEGQAILVLCGPQSDEKASTCCLQTTLIVPQRTQRQLTLVILWPQRGPAQRTHRCVTRGSKVALQHSTGTKVTHCNAHDLHALEMTPPQHRERLNSQVKIHANPESAFKRFTSRHKGPEPVLPPHASCTKRP